MDAPEELLVVGWTCPKDKDTKEQCGPHAYYVRVRWDEERRRIIGVPFARERDAEMGKQALLRAGLDTLEKLIENKPRLREIMCSALQW